MFVPINTLVYVGVPPEKNNSVSGIVNLSRNMGGDIGIAAVTTLLARRSQMHQNNLVAHADPFSRAYDAAVKGIAASLQRSGFSEVDATRRALAVIYRQLFQQATTLSYVDVLFLLGCSTACMLPLLLLLKKNPLGGKAQMGH
jgi:DHA2 family multidrug resistance protein